MYKLTLSGEGLQVEQEVDQRTALAIVNHVFGGGEAAQVSESHQQLPTSGESAVTGKTTTPAIGEGLSVGELIAQASARRNPDKIVVMGLFLKQRGKSEFTKEDIKPLFQAAGEPTPANYARDWRWAQSAKWIAPVSGDNKLFYVTTTGQKAFDGHFSVSVRKQTPQPANRRTRKKTEEAE